jgi:ABC-type Mn2+/Zn2+ transport systems, permease components
VFDKKLAEAEGINTQFFSMLIITFMCIAVVLMLEVVGGFLVFSLIYIPYIVSLILSQRADLQLMITGLFGIIITPLGAYLSLVLDTPIGSTIALTISISAIVIYIVKKSTDLTRNHLK